VNDDSAVVAGMLGEPVSALERVGQGRNSRVYRVSCRSGDYAAKFYFQKTADGRDRLRAEYGALQFLWDAGVRCIARPVRADPERQIALYEFVNGAAIEIQSVSGGDLNQLIGFAATLRRIADSEASQAAGAAAEAFFSIRGVVANIEARIHRLEALEITSSGYDALRRFLRVAFVPIFSDACRRAQSMGGSDPELEHRYRTLSPSDFGFHNALRMSDGSLVFLDFEYFGWDDPVKMLSDLLLHPMMALSAEQRSRLARGLDEIFRTDPGWKRRVEALYPLFGLKWCMIMLNEFLPTHIARNRFTERDSAQIEVVQARQLRAAAAMLERIRGEMDRFPYWSAAAA
jgi:hypothetical protein